MSSMFVIAILLVAVSFPQSPSNNAPAAVVTMNGQIRLDNVENFDFRRLSIFMQHRPGKYYSWTTDGSFTPDESGRFVIRVPAGNWISMEVTTTDPTIRHSRDAPGNEDVGFYKLEKEKKQTVLLKEFYVPSDSSGIEQAIELYRGAAFSVCVPDGVKSGSIQFYHESEKYQNRTSVVTFSDSERLRESLIGGLAAGQWDIRYVDDKDQIRGSQVLELRSGQTMNVKCHQADRAQNEEN
ncbi:MAG TPA: hypothetical protein VFR78_22480 [Pyrinomonadaceae bacterium]|nr:hypothetical protein [Pyrinomonadaceae bacterium]